MSFLDTRLMSGVTLAQRSDRKAVASVTPLIRQVKLKRLRLFGCR